MKLNENQTHGQASPKRSRACHNSQVKFDDDDQKSVRKKNYLLHQKNDIQTTTTEMTKQTYKDN